MALERRDGPTALLLTRQKVPAIPREATGDAGRPAAGGLPASSATSNPEAVDGRHRFGAASGPGRARRALGRSEGKRVNVVSVPCLEILMRTGAGLPRSSLFPAGVPAATIEAGRTDPVEGVLTGTDGPQPGDRPLRCLGTGGGAWLSKLGMTAEKAIGAHPRMARRAELRITSRPWTGYPGVHACSSKPSRSEMTLERATRRERRRSWSGGPSPATPGPSGPAGPALHAPGLLRGAGPRGVERGRDGPVAGGLRPGLPGPPHGSTPTGRSMPGCIRSFAACVSTTRATGSTRRRGIEAAGDWLVDQATARTASMNPERALESAEASAAGLREALESL